LTTAGFSASPLVFATTLALALLFALSRPAYRRLFGGTAVRT
jgi:hypothetical protein